MNKVNALVLLLGLCALPLQAEDLAPPPLKMGAALALSGGVGSSWGEPELQGVQLAISEWNAARKPGQQELSLIVEDTHSDNAGTVKAVKKLIEIDGVELMVGPTWADSFQGALPLIETAKIPAITPSAGSKTMNPKGMLQYVFTMFPGEERQFTTLLETPGRLGLSRVAYIHDEDPYWSTFREMLDQRPPRGVIEVAKESFPVGALEFRSWLTRVKRLSPQAFVGGFATQESSLAFLKQARSLSVNIPLLSVDTLCEFRTDQAFQDLLSGSICVYIDDHPDSRFAARFQARYGQRPSPIASRGYDAVMVLARALSATGKISEIPGRLLKGQHESVSYGPFRFDASHGVAGGGFSAKRLVGGELQPLD